KPWLSTTGNPSAGPASTTCSSTPFTATVRSTVEGCGVGAVMAPRRSGARRVGEATGHHGSDGSGDERAVGVALRLAVGVVLGHAEAGQELAPSRRLGALQRVAVGLGGHLGD